MKILVVDDHAVVREGLQRILHERIGGAILGEASGGAEAVERVVAERWDLVILDISMPGRGGIDALKEIHRLRPALPVLMLSLHGEREYATRAFKAGAAGYITKDSPPDDLVRAVEKLLQGGKYVSPTFAEQLVTRLSADRPPAHEVLSDRELVVLRKLASGKSLKEIAAELHLSEKTISTYKVRVHEKLGLRTNSELYRYALDAGLVD